MDSIVQYFENISTLSRASILIGGLVFFWVAEGIIPMVSLNYHKYRHAATNLFFTLTTMVIGFGMAGLLLWTSDYASSNQFGLLYVLPMPLWAEVLVGVLLLDLVGAYFVHWLEHQIKWMWKFHVVHHCDTDVDVTTGLRHHPGETVFRIGFTILAVLLTGVPIGIIMLYQSLSVLFAHITHANIRLPEGVDRALSWIFVTPGMHKVHHHFTRPWTDANYGNIFSIWDRLFGTFIEVTDSSQIKYGIDTHRSPDENSRLANLLAIPFQRYPSTKGSKFEE